MSACKWCGEQLSDEYYHDRSDGRTMDECELTELRALRDRLVAPAILDGLKLYAAIADTECMADVHFEDELFSIITRAKELAD